MNESFFLFLLEQNCKAALLVLLILLVRYVFRNRLTPALRHSLWFFVVLILVVPTSFFPGPRVSLLKSKMENTAEVSPEVVFPEPTAPGRSVPVSSSLKKSDFDSPPPEVSLSSLEVRDRDEEMDSAVRLREFRAQGNFQHASFAEITLEPAEEKSFAVFPFLLKTAGVLWIFGTGSLLVYWFALIGTFRAKSARSLFVQNSEILRILRQSEESLGIRREIGLYVSDRILSPVLVGIRRPRIVLPKSLLQGWSEEQWKYLFLHELAHQKRRDVLSGFLMSLLCLVHWFNPLLWIAVRKMSRDAEEASDQLALSRLPEHARREYGLTLLSLAEIVLVPSFSKPLQYTPGFAGILESPTELSRRIEMIQSPPQKNRAGMFLAIGLCVFFSCMVSTKLQYVEAKPETPQLEKETTDPVIAQNPQSDPEKEAPEEEVPVFFPQPPEIPDGPAKDVLVMLNQQTAGGFACPDNDEERNELLEKIKTGLKTVEMGLEILPRDNLSPEAAKYLRKEFLQNKVFLFWLLDEYEKGHREEYLEFITELESNPGDREVGLQARGRFLASELETLSYRKKEITEQEFLDAQKQVLDFLKKDEKEGYMQTFALDMLSLSMKYADQVRDRSFAEKTAELFGAMLANSKNEFNRSLSYRMQGILNKHYLDQDGIDIQGILFGGEKFDFSPYREKPTLVVFWRSDPEAGENLFSPAHASHLLFPELIRWYEKYRDQGLEIVGICADKWEKEEVPEKYEYSEEAARSLPWKHNLSDPLTEEAGLLSNAKRYDLFGEYIFFIDENGKILHQQSPNCADFDSANAKGINISGMFGGPVKYLTEELHQKIKDHFSGVEVRWNAGSFEKNRPEGEKYTAQKSDGGLFKIQGTERYLCFAINNHSPKEMKNVELVVHTPKKYRKKTEAVKIINPAPDRIREKEGTYRLSVESLSPDPNRTLNPKSRAEMFLELEIKESDRYLDVIAEVYENGELYGKYEILLEVKK